MDENQPIDSLASNELLERARTEEDEEMRWRYVSALHRRGDRETMDRAVEFLGSQNPGDRNLGADILGQLGAPGKPFLEERFSRLMHLLEKESDLEVLASAATALGHLGDPRGVDALLQLAHHPAAEVRFSVAWALPFCLEDPEDERGVRALIELSNDEDEDVRDWAVFGLGSQLDVDSPAIRDALYSRIDDVHGDTRDEALVGLAHRGDKRVVEPLLGRLSAERVGKLAVEAAREIGDERLYDALISLREWWDVDNDLLAEAIERCRPRA